MSAQIGATQLLVVPKAITGIICGRTNHCFTIVIIILPYCSNRMSDALSHGLKLVSVDPAVLNPVGL
jgi:hypothetical protein